MSQTIEKNKRKYSLHALVLEQNPELSISEGEFESFKKAKICLNSALALEENYDLLLSNYREFELEVLSASLTDMISFSHDYEDFFEIRTSINRRALNLLSATRRYLDQYSKHLKKVGANPAEAKAVCSKAYDDFFEYRFMEALRNHVQHEGLAVHSVTKGGSWLPPHDPKLLQFSIKPYALKADLEGTEFKKSILRESPDKVDLIYAARVHVGGISSVHKKVRELIKPFVEDARRLFEDALARHEVEAKKHYPGLAAIVKEGDVVIEKVPIFLDWDDVRRKLLTRNRSVENLAKRFVTSQAEKDVK